MGSALVCVYRILVVELHSTFPDFTAVPTGSTLIRFAVHSVQSNPE